jgi:hypothetical protein
VKELTEVFVFLALINAPNNIFFSLVNFPPHHPTMDISKYTECLSQWPAHIESGLPAIGALLLLATGGLVVACKVWSFVRVLLSLFVLPGKPVCTPRRSSINYLC